MGEGGVDVEFGSLRPISSTTAIVLPTTIGDTQATIVDETGASVGTVTIPMEPIRANLAYDRLVVATDATSHVWYGEWDDEQPVYMVNAALSIAP